MPGWRGVVSMMHSLGKNLSGPNGRRDKHRGKMGSKPRRRCLRRTRRRRRRIATLRGATKSALLYGICMNIYITGYHALPHTGYAPNVQKETGDFDGPVQHSTHCA